MAEPAQLRLYAWQLNRLSRQMARRLLAAFRSANSSIGPAGITADLLTDQALFDELAEAMASVWGPTDIVVSSMVLSGADLAALEGFEGYGAWREVFRLRAEQWSAAQGSSLVTNVTNETRKALSQLMADSFNGPVSLREAANAIRELPGFGLTRAQTGAMTKEAAALLKRYPNDRRRAMRAIQRVYNRKLRSRAKIIARTESAFAGNYAADIGYREAEAAGEIDGSVFELEWLTRNFEVCPICLRFKGARRPLSGGVFVSSDGELKERPPAHVHCYCGMRTVRIRAAQSVPVAQAA